MELSGIISSAALHHFALAADRLAKTLDGAASLDGSDLGLAVEIKPTSLGHMTLTVEMRPHHTQLHHFEFDGDQTDLPPIARQCRAILARLPVARVLR